MDAETCFYTEKFTRRFPVPLLAFEYITHNALTEENPEAAVLLYADTLRNCCGIEDPSLDDIAYLIQRLLKASEEAEQEAKDDTPNPKKGFGHALSEYLKDLPVAQTILVACQYDYEKARKLYCDVDRDDTMACLLAFAKSQSHLHVMRMESCLFGFGGGYEKNSNSTVKTVDMRKGDVDVDALNAAFNFH